MKAVVFKANGLAMVVDFPEGEDKLHWYYDTIGCRCIDIVKPYGLEQVAKMYDLKAYLDKFSMVVDDEGLLVDEPQVNVVASLLYGADDHGQVLCGDVLIVKDEETEEGIDSVGLNDAEVNMLFAAVNSLIEMHNEKVKADE